MSIDYCPKCEGELEFIRHYENNGELTLDLECSECGAEVEVIAMIVDMNVTKRG